MTKDFNETIAIDLKLWEGKLILHIIDMFTRYSISCFVQNDNPGTIVEGLMMHWFCYFGYQTKAIMNDNGGEFVVRDMVELKSLLDIRRITTEAEAPFQHGLCEKVVFIRHGSVYVRASVNKVIRRGKELTTDQEIE